MANFSELQHPIPKGEIPFQEFCLRLFRKYWNDDLAELHGRKGQKQDGADLTGRDNRNGYKNAGVQCKGSDTHEPRALTTDELDEEVKKAKRFTPPLDILIVAYAGKRDATLQQHGKKLSAANEAAGLFRVEVWSWEDIVQRSEPFAEIVAELMSLNGAHHLALQLNPKRPTTSKAAALEKLQGMLAEAVQAVFTDDTPAAEIDPVHQGKIDVFRDQILQGDGKSVINGLRTFIAGLHADASPRVRFRANANLGAALTQAGLYDQAAIAFDDAVAAEPDTAEGRAYAARAAVMRNRTHLAFKEASSALELDPKQRLAAAMLVDTAPAAELTPALEARVSEVAAEADVGWALSRRYSRDGAHDDALRVARAIEIKDENWTRDLAIGEAIVNRYEKDFAARMGAPQTATTLRLFKEAVECLERAWSRIKGRSDCRNWAHVAANLGAAYRYIGEDEKADALALEALELAPELLGLKERAAVAHMRAKNFDKAIELSEEVAEAGGSEEALLAASIAASPQKWHLVRKWAQRAYDKATEGATKGRAAELLVLAEFRLADAATALTLADTLRPTFAPSITLESRVAEIARRSGDAAKIEAAKARIAAFDPSTLHAVERFELADAYSDNGEWGKAADLLADLHTTDRPSEILSRRLFALYRANRRADARALYESLGKQVLASKEIRRMGAAIYERSGMLPEAFRCLEVALQIDPKDLRSRLDWARIAIRSDNEKAVARWIKKAGEDFEGDASDWLEFAQLLMRHGRRAEALALGYKTLRKNWGKSERIHLAYQSLFLSQGGKKDKSLHPKAVAEDTVVFLADASGGKLDYRIENTEPSADVLLPDHPFAQELIGAKVGDVRVSQPSVGQARTFSVIEIKSKFVDLFHRALAQHPTLFPGSRMLGSFDLDTTSKDGLEPIFEQVRERARYAEDVSKLYEEQLVPIDFAAKMLGVDGIDASIGLRFRIGKGLDNCVGLSDERAAAIAQMRGANRIVVDYVTVALWNEIGFLPVLEVQNHLEVQVVQTTLDALKQRSEDAAHAVKQKGGALVVSGDKIAFVEPTDSDRKANAERWKNLEQWVRSHAIVIPAEAIPSVDEEDIARVLSPAAIDTIATSAVAKLALVSEDRRLRMLAQSFGTPVSAWTQPLLMAMLEDGRISRGKYVELLAKLQQQRIGFVSVGPDDLLTAAELGNSEQFDALAEALTAGNVDPRSIFEIAKQVIFELWRNPRLLVMRERFTSKVLYSLVTSHPQAMLILRILIPRLLMAVQGRPFPMSLMVTPFANYLQTFLKGHFLWDLYHQSN